MGQKYDNLIVPLDNDQFMFKTIYSAGFAFSETGLGRLKGKIGSSLREETKLFYPIQYSEYYARAIWAQVISLVWIGLTIFMLLAGIFTEMTVLLAPAGIIFSLFMGYYFLTYVKEKLKTRTDACEKEFPNAISKLALLVNSGVILHEAWFMVAQGKDGEFYELMRRVCVDMENGKSDAEAIYAFGVLTNSADIKKFTSALIQNINRGGGELSFFLATQSSELWAEHRQYMLQKGEQAAGALLMPITLMLGGVMLIVVSSAVQGLGM